mgnify:CR=1 FL=1
MKVPVASSATIKSIKPSSFTSWPTERLFTTGPTVMGAWLATKFIKVAGYIVGTLAGAAGLPLFLNLLGIDGNLTLVGAPEKALSVSPFALLFGRRSLSGSLTGSPAALRQMLDFCARHHIEPVVETYPMRRINDAMARLAAGKARYRIVLENDF